MFASGAYVDVWDVKPVMDQNGRPQNNVVDASVSSSRRMEDGTYQRDFSDFVRFYNTKNGGTAATDLLNMKSNHDGGSRQKIARIRLGNVGVKNSSVRQSDGSWKRYYNFYCWDFETMDNAPQAASTGTQPTAPTRPQANSFMDIPEGAMEELPF